AQARSQAVIISRQQRTLRAVAEFNETAVTKALALLKALQVLDEAGVRGILAECVDVLATSKDTGLVAKALSQLLRIGEQAETLKAIVASGTKAGGGGLADIIPAERQAASIKDEEGGSGAEDFVSILMARRGARLKGGGSAPPALPSR
ncbi:MAG: hypothetical protein ACREJF_07045, partial [Candidatus Methylomirabilales bacterium]